MKKVSEVFKLPVVGEFGTGIMSSHKTEEILFEIDGATQEEFDTLAHCLNTYDQLKEERDELKKEVARLKKYIEEKEPLYVVMDNNMIQIVDPTVSGDDTDKEE